MSRGGKGLIRLRSTMAHPFMNRSQSCYARRHRRWWSVLFLGRARAYGAAVAALAAALWVITAAGQAGAGTESPAAQPQSPASIAPPATSAGAVPAASTATPPPAGHGDLDVIIDAGTLSDLRWPNFTDYRPAVEEILPSGRIRAGVDQRGQADCAGAGNDRAIQAGAIERAQSRGLRRIAMGRTAGEACAGNAQPRANGFDPFRRRDDGPGDALHLRPAHRPDQSATTSSSTSARAPISSIWPTSCASGAAGARCARRYPYRRTSLCRLSAGGSRSGAIPEARRGG